MIATQFDVLFEVVACLWQFLDAMLLAAGGWESGCWFAPTSRASARPSRLLPRSAIGAILTVVELELIRDIGLGIVFTLWTVWWIWLLVLLLRHGDPVPPAA